MQVPLIRLQCGVNSYAWGKVGEESLAAKFAAATPAKDFSIQSDKPYAELWMGTHPSNPSRDVATSRTLLDLVEDNEALLSSSIIETFGKKLPFLFKILSINQALSIQAHPNKKLAEQLHARDPKNYPDDNHKPEMTLAVTSFEGLCGFRPLGEIAHFLETVPPLRSLVGEENAAAFVAHAKTLPSGEEAEEDEASQQKSKKLLRDSFAGLMSASEEAVAAKLEALLPLVQEGSDEKFAAGGVASTSGAVMAELVRRTHSQYGVDVGIFILFFLNYVQLEPGEGLFLVADDIHAYISGDIVECMAASDNVVRAGLTPKFKDVDTLVDMLTYNYAPIEKQKMVPKEYPYVTLNRHAYSSGSAVDLYDPPIDEFSVLRTVLRGHAAKATFEAIAGPSIVICTQGRGYISVGPKTHAMEPGYVYFVGATAELVLQSQGEADDDEFITFKAFVEVAH